jgi:hypothetical protein
MWWSLINIVPLEGLLTGLQCQKVFVVLHYLLPRTCQVAFPKHCSVCRLLFLHEGKVVWQGMTDEFMTSANPIVQQVRIVVVVLKPSEFSLHQTSNSEFCLHVLPNY